MDAFTLARQFKDFVARHWPGLSDSQSDLREYFEDWAGEVDLLALTAGNRIVAVETFLILVAWFAQLDSERKRLARGTVTGAIPEDLAREEQHRIAHELSQAQKVLATSQVIYAHIEDTLSRALALVGQVDEVYQLGGPRVRRLVNQCFFDKLLISTEDDMPEVAGATLREPWASLLAAEFIQEMTMNTTNPGRDLDGRGSNMMSL